jgi:hypothetical protein
MKKLFSLLSLVLICILFIGCNSNNSAHVKLTAQKLNNQIDKIISQVEKVKTINNKDIELNNLLNDYIDKTSNANNYINNTSNQNKKSDIKTNYYKSIDQDTISLSSFAPTQRAKKSSITDNNLSMSAYNKKAMFSKATINDNNTNIKKYNNLLNDSSNCIQLNTDLSSIKEELIKNCANAKKLLNNLKSTKKIISNNEIKTLNNYYEAIEDCFTHLKNCYTCSDCAKKISTKKLNLANNADSIHTDYLKISNCLENNCILCNNANKTLKELIDEARDYIHKALKNDDKSVITVNSKKKFNILGEEVK